MNIIYELIDQQDIDRIEPLWYKLTEHHKACSRYFKNVYASARWENRKQQLFSKFKYRPGYIQLATDGDITVGYCVSSLDAQRVGEVESLYIQPAYRGFNVGSRLLVKALNWMDSQKASRKIIVVGEGNEEVCDFYARFRFQTLGHSLVQTSFSLPEPDSTADCRINSVEVYQIDLIKYLWDRLKKNAGYTTPVFKETYLTRKFTDVKTAAIRTAAYGWMNLDLVYPAGKTTPVGYCLSTVNADKAGVIDSIYLHPEYRNQGLGCQLIQRSLDWMNTFKASRKSLFIAAGNSNAGSFFSRFNFKTRNTFLQQVKS